MLEAPLALLLFLASPPQEPAWFGGSFEQARSAAAADETLIALYFFLEDSEHCQRMDETLASPSAQAELRPLVCLRVDAASAAGAPLLARYGIQTLPTVQFVDGQGNSEDALIGFYEGERFTAEVARIRRRQGTVGALRRALEAAPEDLDLRLQLALKLQHVGDLEGYQRELTVVQEADPAGKTLAGARVALWRVMSQVRTSAADPNQSATYDLNPLREHLALATHTPVLREGWEWIAQVEQMRGDRSAARAALMRAAPHVEDSERISWSRQTVYSFFSMRDELEPAERRFTLELATHSVELGRAAQLDKQQMAVIHVSRARALAMNERTKEALVETERALELAPDLTEARTFLGWLEEL